MHIVTVDSISYIEFFSLCIYLVPVSIVVGELLNVKLKYMTYFASDIFREPIKAISEI